LLTSFGLPNESYVGMLRENVNVPRQKLLLLIAMVWEVVEEEILLHLKSNKSKPKQDEAKKVYLNSLLIYLRLLFCSKNLDHDPIYGIEAENEVDAFWRKCIQDQIISKYDGLLQKEKESRVLIREKVLLCKYQLIRIFEDRTGLRLKSSSKERLFANDKPEISLNDVDVTNYDGLEVNNVNLWEQFREFFSSSGSVIMDEIQKDMQFSLIKTPEYCNALSTLMCADVYRAKHPFLAGYTVLGKYNNLVSKKDWTRRVDYILSWDYLGDENAKVKLQPLECTSIIVRPFGDTADTQLSAHFPIEAELSI